MLRFGESFPESWTACTGMPSSLPVLNPLWTDLFAAHPEHPWHHKILFFRVNQQQIQLALSTRLWCYRGSLTVQDRAWDSRLVSWPRSHCFGIGCSKQTAGWKPKYIKFFEVALKCRCTTCLQTSPLAAGNFHTPNLALPTQAQRVMSKSPCCIGGRRTVHASCLQTWWPFHRLLFQSWGRSQSFSGGK